MKKFWLEFIWLLNLQIICWQDVLKKGTGGWKKVVAAFGEDILLPNGEVDRSKLGQIVFSDSSKRQLLNGYGFPFCKKKTVQLVLICMSSLKQFSLDMLNWF